jgi:AhpD family alkylhydroperoxidase
MRLRPIDRPSGLLLRLAYWFSKRRFGRVIMPIRVIYARMPRFVRPHAGMVRFLENGLSLDRRLRHLMESWVSMLNGCRFCGDLHEAIGLDSGLEPELFRTLPRFETEPGFSEHERAALAYAQEVVRQRRAEDATFERLQRSFDETQIVELTWLIAYVTYLNMLALPLGIESDNLCALRQERAPRKIEARAPA